MHREALASPLVPAPHPMRRGIIQPMRGLDLANASTQALAYVTVQAATEVQALHVDGNVAMTANTPGAMAALSSKQVNDLIVTLSALPPRLAGAQRAVDLGACAAKLANSNHQLIILTGEETGAFVVNKATSEGDTLHAEQRLLLSLALIIADGKIPDTMHIWGAKPPCGTCLRVLRAFSSALADTYDKTLLFSREAGQPRTVNEISLAGLFRGGSTGELGIFVRKFESAMGR